MNLLRTLRAFVWLRWRLLVNSLRGGRRRDTLEQISRVLALLVPIMLTVMSLGMVAATCLLGFVGGRSAANGLLDAPFAVFVLRVALAIMVVILLIFAIIVPTQTSLTRYTRLLLLPISRRALHVVEVAASLADPWLLWIVPALFVFGAGMFVGGRAAAAMMAVSAALVLVLLMAALNSLVSFLVTWLIRNRRRSEMFTLIFVVGITGVSLVPAFFAKNLGEREKTGGKAERRAPFSAQAVDAQLPAWTRALPTELYGRVVLDSLQRNTQRAALGLAALAGEFVVLFVLSGLVHRQLLGTPEGGRRRSRRDATDISVIQLPLLGPRASAVAWAQARTAIRSVRGRLMLFLSGPLVAVMLMVFHRLEDDERWLIFVASQGYLIAAVGGIFGLYSLQAFSMNMFGSDRSGLTLQFISPISDAELAHGKTAGCVLIMLPTVALALISALAVSPNGSPFLWLSSVLGVFATLLWLSPVAVWLSALFPLAADLSKTGSGGNPHALPMLAGTFLVLILAAPAAIILAIGAFWWEQPILTLLMMSAWTALAFGVAYPLVTLASRAITLRRENLGLVAQGK